MSPRDPARAEVVGSLLRPSALRRAIETFYAEGHSAVLADERRNDRAALTALEDEAIRDVVARQIDLGLDVVSDGEFRRWMFLNSFYDAVDGFRTDNVVNFRNARGEDVPLRVHEIVERLRPVDSPGAREAAFLAEVTDGKPFKVTGKEVAVGGEVAVGVAWRRATTVGSSVDPAARLLFPDWCSAGVLALTVPAMSGASGRVIVGSGPRSRPAAEASAGWDRDPV